MSLYFVFEGSRVYKWTLEILIDYNGSPIELYNTLGSPITYRGPLGALFGLYRIFRRSPY